MLNLEYLVVLRHVLQPRQTPSPYPEAIRPTRFRSPPPPPPSRRPPRAPPHIAATKRERRREQSIYLLSKCPLEYCVTVAEAEFNLSVVRVG